MSQEINPEDDEDMLPEYDFRSRCARQTSRSLQGRNERDFLEPDLAKVFRDSDSVNRVLRLSLSLAKENVTNTPA